MTFFRELGRIILGRKKTFEALDQPIRPNMSGNIALTTYRKCLHEIQVTEYLEQQGHPITRKRKRDLMKARRKKAHLEAQFPTLPIANTAIHPSMDFTLSEPEFDAILRTTTREGFDKQWREIGEKRRNGR